MIDGVAATVTEQMAYEMKKTIDIQGRKMVTIIDPHIKKDPAYKVYQDAMVR